MRLPSGARGLVEREKIVKYLLNLTHPEGAGKARFFLSLGFRLEKWPALADALLGVAVEGIVAQVIESAHGVSILLMGSCVRPTARQ